MSSFPKNLLIIQAHPDDAEAWSGGTLALMAKSGWNITIATMTDGSMGGIDMTEAETAACRLREAVSAADVIGADYYNFKRRDGYLFDEMSLRIETVSLIRRTRAGIIITHAPFDYHQDHRTTCTVVDSAAMLASLPNVPCGEKPLKVTPLLYHGMPMSFSDPLGFPVPEPHFFIDISGEPASIRLEMLSKHTSQQELMKIMHKMDDFFGEMSRFTKEIGTLVGVEEAECYWQHLGGGYQKNPLMQEVLKKKIRHRKEET